jgi:DNA-damage-inducible protein J
MIIVADTTNISIRMDVELKKQAEKLFSELGMNMTTAFNIFLRQAVRQQRIPFDVALEVPNAETIAAMEEAERISRDPSVKGYTDVELMMKELLDDV